ncbi:MAG TPA: hypothetical protein VN802_22180 [Stellaceae bacterium]|nr:hypothetical protein [Stellaceae bacterium]
MRIVSNQQTVIPPASSQREAALFARRASDIVIPSAKTSAPRDQRTTDQSPTRGRYIDIVV